MLSSEIGLLTSEHLCLDPNLYLPNLSDVQSTSINTGPVDPTDNAFKFRTVGAWENDADSDSSRGRFSTIFADVNVKGVNMEEQMIWQQRKCRKNYKSLASMQMHKQSLPIS